MNGIAEKVEFIKAEVYFSDYYTEVKMKGFYMNLKDIQPSQLYISKSKLEKVNEWFNPKDLTSFNPIPVKKLKGKIIFTDGHTRACAALMAGLEQIVVCWDEDELDWEAYERCVEQCETEAISSIVDLKGRIVDDEQYKALWYDWCDKLHETLEQERAL